MSDTVLAAAARSGNAKKVRAEGFIPGILNKSDTTSMAVQFKAGALNKIIAAHGSNAKIYVDFAGEKLFGFVKEIQRNPVEGGIIHVAIQLVSMDQSVKMQLPIVFHGREALGSRSLLLQVIKSEIEVEGKTVLIPEHVVVDVSENEDGTTITAADFKLPAGVKLLDSEDEIYGVVKAAREMPAAEPEAGAEDDASGNASGEQE